MSGDDPRPPSADAISAGDSLCPRRTVNLGPSGTWVINKQTPNRQIWWSSPLSGPMRFQYGGVEQGWVGSRDGTPLLGLLKEEIDGLFEEVDLEFEEE